MKTAVLLIIFNRSDTVGQVIDAIRPHKPERMYIAGDGPRSHKPGEAEACQATRDFVLSRIDWHCNIQTLFQTQNLGPGLGPPSAISWFLEQEQEGIILEDDCLPAPDFFRFCETMLQKFRTDDRVFHIGGNNPAGQIPSRTNAIFSRFPLIWGWATWSRAWQHYERELHSLDEFQQAQLIKSVFSHSEHQQFWLSRFRLAKENLSNFWDIQWVYSVWKQHGLSVLPAKNLVRNLGFGGSAVNTALADHHLANLPLFDIGSDIQLPASWIPEPANEDLLMKDGFHPSFSRRVYYRLKLLQSKYISK